MSETNGESGESLVPQGQLVDVQRVLRWWTECGEEGGTDHEAAEATSTVARSRRNDLINRGYVFRKAGKRPTASGKLATVWVLEPGGPQVQAPRDEFIEEALGTLRGPERRKVEKQLEGLADLNEKSRDVLIDITKHINRQLHHSVKNLHRRAVKQKRDALRSRDYNDRFGSLQHIHLLKQFRETALNMLAKTIEVETLAPLPNNVAAETLDLLAEIRESMEEIIGFIRPDEPIENEDVIIDIDDDYLNDDATGWPVPELGTTDNGA